MAHTPAASQTAPAETPATKEAAQPPPATMEAARPSPATEGGAQLPPGRRGKFDAVSLALLQVMCGAARQLLGLVEASPKWSNVFLVLEAGDGSAASPFYGHIINCGHGTDAMKASESDELCDDWWAFRGGKQGRRRASQAASAVGRRNEDKSDVGSGGGAAVDAKDGDRKAASWTSGDGAEEGEDNHDGDDGIGDAVSPAAATYPEQQMLTRSAVKAMTGGVMGTKTLTEDALAAVLVSGGLESIKEVTYGDIEEIFLRAAKVLRARCDAKNAFSWARFCPVPLLANRWSTPMMRHIVDGSDFVPPNHRSSKGQGVDKKRLMVCVAVHLSPFYAKIFEEHFSACRASGRKKRKRSNDPFHGAEQQEGESIKKGKGAGKGRKGTKAETWTAAARARLVEMDAKNAARVAEEKAAAAKAAADSLAARSKAAANAAAAAASRTPLPAENPTNPQAAGGGLSGAMLPMAPAALCVLERTRGRARLHEVWTRQPVPLLPSSTVLTVVSLCGAELSAAARASVSVRVVLPRFLLKQGFDALTAASRAASPSQSDAASRTELAVRLTLGNHDPVLAFESTLLQMSSVLAFNDAIVSSRMFLSWMSGLEVGNDMLPAPLNFCSGKAMGVKTMAAAVRSTIAGRLLGDCVWALPPTPAPSFHRAFGGYSVNVQDMCDAGQRAFLTNALLDASLAELDGRCVTKSLPVAVLSCSQSASFTTVAGKEVSLERAVESILEVLSTWDASVDRFVMLFNIGNYHWISASVSLLSRSVVMYDSMVGTSSTKEFILSRLLLFARQAELRRRVVYKNAVLEDIPWRTEKEVNRPLQQDSHNCGVFAFAFVWCSIHGVNIASLNVVGDHLRLSLLYFILQCGVARAAQRGIGQDATG